MDKRTLTTMLIALGGALVVIPMITKKEPPKPAAPPAATAPAAATPSSAAPAVEATETTVEEPGHYRATFTSHGAALSHFVLLDPHYKEDHPRLSNQKGQPIDLVRSRSPYLPLETELTAAGVSVPADADWTLEPRGSDGAIVFSWHDANVRVEKRFVQVPKTYELRLFVTVENLASAAATYSLRAQMHGWHNPNVKPGMFTPRVSSTTTLCYVDGKVKRASYEDLQKAGGHQQHSGNLTFVATSEQYFIDALAVKPGDTNACWLGADSDGTMGALLTVGPRTVQPRQKTEYELTAFLGPKMISQLDAVDVAGQSAHFGDAIDYGWLGSVSEWLARPMLAVLKAIHYVVRNWGVAIILFTLLIKLITFYPTQSSMKSMKAMAKLKPEMDKLKERFPNDKNAQQVAMMELYKKHGVNPIGGCLPVLIQMPIYIALYAMLGNSVELYRSPFVGWIRDLTAADPYFVLPILTGALMFLQQKTQPTPPDPQQKMMMYMMPIMFTAFSIFLPAGLTIYILTNTLLTFLQQWWMNRHDKTAGAALTPKKA